MKSLRKSVIRSNSRISDEAEKKSLSVLSEEADACIRINEFFDIDSYKPLEIEEAIDLAFSIGFQLGRKSGKKDVYRAHLNEAMGVSSFFFVGSKENILRRLKKVANEWE